MRIRHFLVALWTAFYACNCLATGFAGFNLFGSANLDQELNQIVRAQEDNAEIAVYIKSMKSGEILYSRNIWHPLTPASTLKVLTAEAALLYLGPEYRFSTQLLTNAKGVQNGVLQGNLYIVLSGDPTLTYYDLMDLLEGLKDQQVTAIAGNVYIDNTAYDQRFYGPGWDQKDKQSCYGAPISASIINHNCLALKVAPSKVSGKAAKIVTSPQFFYPPIRNTVITKRTRSRTCSMHLSSLSKGISIEGCLRKGQPHGFSYVVTDIPEYNRALFKGLLTKMNVKVFGNVTFGSAPLHSTLIAHHASEPLHNMIIGMLKKSDNVIAGAIFKKTWAALYPTTGKLGKWQYGSSRNISKKYWFIIIKIENFRWLWIIT